MRRLARRLHEQDILDAISKLGLAGSVDVAEATGLPHRTVTGIVEELIATGGVRVAERETDGTVVQFEVEPVLGHIVGVDLGGTKIRAALCDMSGAIRAEHVRPTDLTSPDAVIDQIRALTTELADEAGIDSSTVCVLSLATPGAVHPDTGHISLAYNLPAFADDDIASRLGVGNSLRVVLDNDVNMAAVGERWRGLARSCDSFAFVAIGTGIGMGVMLNGEIWHGHGGEAGEIGYLPLGRDPFDPAVRRRGAFEEAAAGPGIVAAYSAALRERGGSAPSNLTAAAVFDAAGRGEELATTVVDEVARVLATAIVAVNAVVAPEMVVLGGGVGANTLLVDPVRRYVRELVPNHRLRIETSALSSRASLIGALAIGLSEARSVLCARDSPAPKLTYGS